MEEDIKNNEFIYYNDEWNGIWLKDEKHIQIITAESNFNKFIYDKKHNDNI